jgi:hypothetical protein
MINEKFINEIIDSESEKLSGVKDATMNFLLLEENNMSTN